MKGKSFLFLILCLFSHLTPVAAQDGNTLVLSSITQPETLDPLEAENTVGVHVLEMIFSSLVQYGEGWEPVPALAKSWDVSDDGRVWTFYLREGVLFHDGTELTAADVVSTYEVLADPESGSPFASLYGRIESFDASDPYLFKVFLTEPFGPLLFSMNSAIVPARFLRNQESREELALHPVGSGPFRVESRNEKELTLSAFPGYFEGKPHLDRVIIRFYPEPTSAWSALMRGDVDAVSDLNFEDYRIIEQDPRFRTYEYFSNFYYTVLFNTEDPLFEDPRLRRAVSLVIDREDLIETVLEGWGRATTGPFRPESWPYNPRVEYQSFDPQMAVAILEELGWVDSDGDLVREKGDEELILNMVLDEGDTMKGDLVRRLRWQLIQAGIGLEVSVLTLNEMIRERLIPGEYQSALLQFNAGIDPDSGLSVFWHSDNIGRGNLARYGSDETDKLISLGRRTSLPEERVPIYQNIHEKLAGDCPAAFLFFHTGFAGVNSRFQGVTMSPALLYRSIRSWRVVP